MPIIQQSVRNTEFLLSEAGGERSREQVVLLPSTESVSAGTIMVLGTGGYEAYDAPETPVAITAAVAIIYNNKAASEDEQLVAAIVRDAEVDGDLLVGLNDASLTALASQGIIVR